MTISTNPQENILPSVPMHPRSMTLDTESMSSFNEIQSSAFS